MRALVIEDDAALREQIGRALRAEGFALDESGDGVEGLYLATEMPIDIVVVDLGLPSLDGLELLRRVRAAGVGVPILVLTARDAWQDKVEGLEAGADDYLTKPFRIEELVARVRALLRRTGGWAESVLRFGRLEIDTRRQIVTVDDEAVELTAYEYRVLAYLATRSDEVIPKSVLLDHLYDEDVDRDPNVLEVFVRRLRVKLDPDGALRPIATLRGRGYRLALERTSADAGSSPDPSPDAGSNAGPDAGPDADRA